MLSWPGTSHRKLPEKTLVANAYRGELLGLMAVHLLLLSIDKVEDLSGGSAHIYSDCLGALSRVSELPPQRIPSRCRHSDILKTILVSCGSLELKHYYSHVKSHQDDHKKWQELSRESKLNVYCDAGAKGEIYEQDPTDLPWGGEDDLRHRPGYPLRCSQDSRQKAFSLCWHPIRKSIRGGCLAPRPPYPPRGGPKTVPTLGMQARYGHRGY
mmetsp:Transcript_42563/g.89338  ORF Transcript_42563/g.89338 Transcript_42563/m.89338 type:complete len:212 (+) Transcript_42563:1288-1923(+)